MTALLVEVTRNGYVEAVHRGSVVALRPDGSTALALGDLARPVFPRSSNKPLQAVGLLEAGWQPADDRQLALAASSHSGEPDHLEAVRQVLGDLELGCPALPPLSEEAWKTLLREGGDATPLTMTCSGKHAAMLRTCAVNGWSTQDYLSPEHPVQRACQTAVEELTDERVEHVAVDGCGAPAHAVTLTGLARAYGRVATHRVGDAMRAEPWYVAGTGRDATLLMEGVPGLVCKDGFEGVYAASLADGSAVALKIDDGSLRARVPVLVAALRALGIDAPVLDELATLPVLGGGVRVGDVRLAAGVLTH